MRLQKILPLPLLLLTFLGALFFQKSAVRVERDTPDRIAPGGSEEVTVRIHKGDRSGFAKLELDVGKGIKVEAVEKSGASFTFEDGSAKFIWMAMPKGAQFVVKYRLMAEESLEKKKVKIGGSFRYLEDNKRKEQSLENKDVRIGEGDAPQKEEKEEAGQDEEKPEASQDIEAERTIEKMSDERFRVQIELQKGKLQNFGKVTDKVPEGFEAIPEKEKGSSFTFEGQEVKFVWMSLPKEPTLKVVYRLVPKSASKGSYRLEGSFSFLKDEQTLSRSIPASEFKLEEESDKTADEQEEQEEEKEDEEPSVTDVPDPQKGVDYRVQICAGHDEVASDHFAKVYDYQGDYDIDHHDGWLKYLTGTFDRYEKARDKRVYFRENFDLPGPFVTAYNEGERITVQEALMITDQEWVQ